MADPIGSLINILNGKKTPQTGANSDFATPNYQLPNGAGTYNVNGVNQPVMPQMPFTPQQAQVQPIGPFANTPSGSTGGYEVPAGADGGAFSQPQPGSSGYTPSPTPNPAPVPQPAQEETGGVDYLDKYRQLALEQARHSSQGTGLYALQKGVQYTPDQIMAQRKSADDIYNQTLGEYSKAAQGQLAKQKATPAYGTDSILSGLSTVGASRVNKLTDNFDSSPIVKNYNTVQNSALKAQEILNDIQTRPDKFATAGDDMTLMYLFAKAQDPESVVRESEYANVADYFSSLPQNVKYQLSRVYKNTPDGRLTDDSRANIFNNLNKLYDAQTSQYNNLKSETIRKINDVAGREVGDSLLTDYSNAYSNRSVKNNTGGFAEDESGTGTGTKSTNPYAVSWDNILD